MGAESAAHARTWPTWPGEGGGVGAAAVSGAAARRDRREEGDGSDRWAPPVGDPERGGSGAAWAAGLGLGLRPAQQGGGKEKGKWADGPFDKKEEKERKKEKEKEKGFFPGINNIACSILIVLAPSRALPWPHHLSPPSPSLSPAPATSSRTSHHDRAPSGCSIATLGLAVVSPPLHRVLCTGRRRHHFPRLRDAVLISGLTSSSPEARRSGLLVGVQYLTSSGRLLFLAGEPAYAAVSSLGTVTSPFTPPCPRFCRNAAAAPASPSSSSTSPPAAPSAVPVRRPTSSSPPSASQWQGRPWPRLPSTRTPLAFIVTTPPVFVVVLLSFPVALVVGPPFVKPIAFAARVSSSVQQPRRRLHPRLRVVKPYAGRVSSSSKDRRRSRPLAVISVIPVRLRCPFTVVVPTPRRVVVRISPSLPRPRSFCVALCPLCGCRPWYPCTGVGSRSCVRVVTVFVCPLGSRVVSTCAARVVSSGVRLSATRLG
uniref:Uncharacterized protein n=1 Tax=Oryza sativa subsp. japonica TaxID=39947 RepID=Q8S790_ORYSJ|nr:Hypothetical protein [Oryza sativa Japonica Group]